MNQHAKYLSFYVTVLTNTDMHTWLIALPIPLKWLVNNYHYHYHYHDHYHHYYYYYNALFPGQHGKGKPF